MVLIIHLGPMFSGKTTSLCQELTRYSDIGMKCLFISPITESRNTEKGDDFITTHNSSFSSLTSKVDRAFGDLTHEQISSYSVIGIDEVQFASQNAVEMMRYSLMNTDTIMVCSGLNGDFNMKPFPIISELIPLATDIQIHYAFCQRCLSRGERSLAHYTAKIGGDLTKNVEVGGADMYQPMCLKCMQELKRGDKHC